MGIEEQTLSIAFFKRTSPRPQSKSGAGVGVAMGGPPTPARMLDKLFSALVEPELLQPTFVIDHPHVMSPLAKQHRADAALAERAEAFVAGREIANLYTEQNDPLRQRELLAANARDGQGCAHEDFCQTLELGMPPAAGCGIGIDRLVMLLADAHVIRDVVLFPLRRSEGGAE